MNTIASMRRRIILFLATFLLVASGCCSHGFCDDEKSSWELNKKLLNAGGSERDRFNGDESASSRELLEDFRLFEYLWCGFGLPNWEMKRFNGGDQNEYSSDVRSKIKQLPSGYFLQNLLNEKTEQIIAISRRCDPDSPNYLPWLHRWILDEVPDRIKENYSREDNLHLLAAIGLLVWAEEVNSYWTNVLDSVQELPDEVAWKKDFLQQLNGFFVVYNYERATLYLYEAETRIEELLSNPTPELVKSVSETLTFARQADKANSFLARKPSSRFARLFPKRLEEAAEILKDSELMKWGQENKDKVAGEVNGSKVTVGDAFDMIRSVVETYDGLVKRDQNVALKKRGDK